MREPRLFDLGGEFAKTLAATDVVLGNPEPPEPLTLIGVRPERGVSGPESPHLAVFPPVSDRRFDFCRKIARQARGVRRDPQF